MNLNRKQLGIFILILLLCKAGFAQTNSDYILVSKQDEYNFNQQIILLEAMLKLMTHPLIQPFSDNGWIASDEDLSSGLTIEMHSGLSWHSDSISPQKPFLFIPRAYTKQGLANPSVAKRLYYQQIIKEFQDKSNVKQITFGGVLTDSTDMQKYHTKFIYEYNPSHKLILKEKLYTKTED